MQAAPLRDLPLDLNVAEGQRHRQRYEGHAFAQRPEGDAHAIFGLGVLDARLHHASSRQRTSNSRTGSSKPRRATSPRSPDMNPLPSASSRTTFAARISPPWASAAMRAGLITAVPNRSPRPSGSSSAIGSPALR